MCDPSSLFDISNSRTVNGPLSGFSIARGGRLPRRAAQLVGDRLKHVQPLVHQYDAVITIRNQAALDATGQALEFKGAQLGHARVEPVLATCPVADWAGVEAGPAVR